MPYTPKETLSPSKSAEPENGLMKPEDDADSDGLHQSDGSLSDCSSDDTIDSKDYDKFSNHSGPRNRSLITQKKRDESEDPLCDENSPALKKPRETNRETRSETAAVPPSNVSKQHLSDKEYCLFCSRPVIDKARHLSRTRSDKVQVEVTFQCPLHLRERKNIWKRHCALNENVLKTGKRQLAFQVKPNKWVKSALCFHCVYCHELYRKEHLFSHVKNCSEKAKCKDKPPGKLKISLCELLSTNCKDLSKDFKKVLDEMEYDEVTEAVMENRIILQFGEHMLNGFGFNVNKHEYLRQNLRHVARLVLEAKKSTPMQSLEDFFDPCNFQHVVSAVKAVAGYDPEKKTYSLPLLAHDLGYHLQIICSIVVRNAGSCGDFRLMELCKDFLSLYSKKWNRIISSRTGANITETKGKNKKDVPIAEDEKRLRLEAENVPHLGEKNKLTDMETADL